MTRQQKYPETKTFHFHNANPKGRIASDCVARAISTALGQPWEQTIREMTELGIKLGRIYNEPKTIEAYLAQKGWFKCMQPRKGDGTKYTGEEFCLKLAKKEKRYVANIGGHHIVAIIDGKVNDIWDSTGKCIGNYWMKK